MTEREIAGRLTAALLRHGGESVPIEPHVQSGPNTALPHGATSDRRVEIGDFLLLDFVTTVAGYYADITRTFVVGAEPTAEQRRVYETVLAANAAGRAAARPGVTGEELDAIVRRVIDDAGYGPNFIHRTGHGLGLEVHEEPQIVAGNRTPLAPGMVFTIEPGIYLPGWGGVRIEDDVVVTEDGCESLTSYSRDLALSLSVKVTRSGWAGSRFLVCVEEIVPVDAGLDEHRTQSRTLDGAMIGHGQWRACPIWIDSYQCNVIALTHQPKSKADKGSDYPGFRRIDRELRHQTGTPVSAIKASRIGESDSSVSRPKVSMWNWMADRTSANASS